MDLFAGNVVTLITVRARHLIPDVARNVKLRNQLQPAPYFIIANSLSAKLSISHTMFARAKKNSHLMNLHGVFPSGK